MEYDLNYYKNQKYKMQQQINDRRNKNARILDEIRQLEDAYNKLGNIKRNNYYNAQKVVNDLKKKNIDNGLQWRGMAKKQLDRTLDEEVKQAADNFFRNIDRIHDEIGSALSRKRGEYDTGFSLLNGLNRTLSQIDGTIKNLTN